MKNNPKFSIIIPSYNYAEYLPDAINSVLDQHYPEIEILVIDDASTDNTPEIAKRYNGQINYHRLNKNLGASGAWCYGLRHARGKYFCKLDADDQQMSGYLETIDNAFTQDETVGLVATSVMILLNNNKLVGAEPLVAQDLTLSPEDFRERFLQEFFFRMPGACIRSNITVSHEPPDHDLYQIHDWEYFLRITRGHKARLIAKPLAIYRIHNRSITKTAQYEGILIKDCRKWLEHAMHKGDSYMDERERKILAGSLAILVMRGIRLPYTPKKFYRYLAVRKIALMGGKKALNRLHVYMIRRGIQLIKSLFIYGYRAPARLIKWSSWRLNRGHELLRKGGIASCLRFIREESKNTWISVTKRLPIEDSKVKVECNVCGWKGKGFHTHCGAGYVVYNCICPSCGSFPRHRGYTYVVEHYLTAELRKINTLCGLKILFAPEYSMYKFLMRYVHDLIGVDFSVINSLVSLRSDIMKLPFLGHAVSFLSCFHVIEHLPDDHSALAELHRILDPAGMAIICVPINFSSAKTMEFGQPNPLLEDHYYDYGLDFGDRLTRAGFMGMAYRLSKIMPKEMFSRLALQDELIFVLRKAGPGTDRCIQDHDCRILYRL